MESLSKVFLRKGCNGSDVVHRDVEGNERIKVESLERGLPRSLYLSVPSTLVLLSSSCKLGDCIFNLSTRPCLLFLFSIFYAGF